MENTQRRELRAKPRDPLTVDVVEIFKTIQGEGPFVGKPAIFVRLAGCNLQCPACDTDYTTNRRWLSFDEIKEQVYALMGLDHTNPSRKPKHLFKQWIIVITGGEPFRQENVLLLATYLSYTDENYDNNIQVQIETNGLGSPIIPDIIKDGPWSHYLQSHLLARKHTTSSEDFACDACVAEGWLTVVCSPKMSEITKELLPLIGYWKYVVRHDNISSDDGLPCGVLGYSENVVAYRPADLKKIADQVYIQPEWNEDPAIRLQNEAAAIDSCMMHGYRLSYQLHKVLGMP